jgi:hypothetical protein
MFHLEKLRPPRFGLRTLLLATTLACIVLALLPHKARQYSWHKARVRQQILSLGGTVEECGFSQEASPGTNWLSRQLGYSEPQEILWRVNFDGRPVGNSQLEWLRGCDWIRILNLSNTKVSDVVLAHVVRCRRLNELRLANTKVSDEGIKLLKLLNGLTVLDVVETDVTYAGLAKLEQELPETNFQEQLALSRIDVPQLVVHQGYHHPPRRSLQLYNSSTPPAAQLLHFTQPVELTAEQLEDIRRLTSAQTWIGEGVSFPQDGFQAIGDLENLEWVHLGGGNLGDDDLRWLPKLPRLSTLDIASQNLTDGAIRHIAAIPELQSLGLGGVNFTDKGIAQLSSATRLRRVVLNGQRLTPALLVHLRRLPQLKELHLYLWYRSLTGESFGPPPADVIDRAREDMKQLAAFPSLEELGTRGNLMVRSALSPTIELAKLQRLIVDGRYVSHEDARQLQEAMPHCHVQRMSGE